MSSGPMPGESVDDYVARRRGKSGDDNKHLKKLATGHLLPREEVTAWAPAFRIGTTFEGIAALTKQRVIFFRSGTFGDKVEPIPIRSLTSVESKRGMMFLDATIHTSNDTLNLRFTDKALGERLLLALQEAMHVPLGDSNGSVAAVTSDDCSAQDLIGQIGRLGELRDAGVLTNEEFTTKKTELLSRL